VPRNISCIKGASPVPLTHATPPPLIKFNSGSVVGVFTGGSTGGSTRTNSQLKKCGLLRNIKTPKSWYAVSPLSSSLYCPTFRPPLSGWLAGRLKKYWSREEYQNRPLLGNRTSERDYVQILRAQLGIREEKLKYLSLYFSSSGI
jgi:hypothetical protein